MTTTVRRYIDPPVIYQSQEDISRTFLMTAAASIRLGSVYLLGTTVITNKKVSCKLKEKLEVKNLQYALI